MKKLLSSLMLFALISALFFSCKKNDTAPPPTSAETSTYTSEVALKWMNMQLRLFRTNPTFLGSFPPHRFLGYTAVALYESVVQGMPTYQTLSGQLSSMPQMPQVSPTDLYHWPTCANAAMAAMNRNFFPAATDANKGSIDSLENTLNAGYKTQLNDTAIFNRSVAFGKAVAQVIFDWSQTDGASMANAAYTSPVGPGLWVPTPPAFAAPFGPYWGNNRLLFASSLSGSAPLAPPAYSTDPASDYYKMMKEVYDVSQTLTPEQAAIALYYRDNPGFGGAHYLSLITQILTQENRSLDFSAYLYAKAGIAVIDAAIGCFKSKYQYNQERPITYIRNVMGYSSWNTLFPTPNFPDFPSAHSVIAGAFAAVLKKDLGNNYQFTSHIYDYLGMDPRTYSSLDAMAQEIGLSRLYAGIHNRIAIERGTTMGNIIGTNINNGVKFLK
jgi:hypothetical protein